MSSILCVAWGWNGANAQLQRREGSGSGQAETLWTRMASARAPEAGARKEAGEVDEVRPGHAGPSLCLSSCALEWCAAAGSFWITSLLPVGGECCCLSVLCENPLQEGQVFLRLSFEVTHVY